MKQYKGFPQLVEVGNKVGKVHVGCTPKKGGKYAITAYATDDNGNKKSPVIGATLVAENEFRIPLVAKVAASRVAEKMQNTDMSSKNTAAVGDDPFSDAFRKLEEYGIENAHPGWGVPQGSIAMRYFRRNTLPFLQRYAADGLCDGDLEDLEELMGNVHSTNNGDDDRKQTSIDHHKAEADIIYRAMQQMSDVDLPDIDFVPSKKRHIDREKPRFLPEKIRTAFTQKVEEMTVSNPLLAKRIIVFYDLGTRNSEAVTVDFDHIPYYRSKNGVEYGLVNVLTQGDPMVPTKVTGRLKGPNSYRSVLLSTWGAKNMQRACSNQPEDPKTSVPITANELSKVVLDMLIECGLTPEMLYDFRALMSVEPDFYISGKINNDITAYILRRDRAARWKNICGLSPVDTDVFLGHVISAPVPSKRKSKDSYKTHDTLEKLVELNENYVYNPEMSGHPLYAPIRLSDMKGRIVFNPHCGQAVVNDTDQEIEVKIHLLAEEPGEPLVVIYPDNSSVDIHPENTLFNAEKVDKHATIGQLNKEYKEVCNNEKNC